MICPPSDVGGASPPEKGDSHLETLSVGRSLPPVDKVIWHHEWESLDRVLVFQLR